MKILKRLLGAQEQAPQEQQPPALRPLPEGGFRFLALDVETANRFGSSICQIGIACVRKDGSIVTWSTYVDPDDEFDPANIAIHGITENTVWDAGAPDFCEALEHVLPLLQEHTVFQHSNFDSRCISEACDISDTPVPPIKWADSVQVARRAWPELKGNGGHGLAHLRDFLSLQFDHHDAEEDARAAAEIVLRAEAHTGSSFEELIRKRPRPSFRTFPKPITAEGSSDGPMAGHIAVFTGSLSITRADAAHLAASAGMSVAASITKKTTILVVGDQDLSLLAGYKKSSKHRKAEEYIAKGQRIRIIGETEFVRLVSSALSSDDD